MTSPVGLSVPCTWPKLRGGRVAPRPVHDLDAIAKLAVTGCASHSSMWDVCVGRELCACHAGSMQTLARWSWPIPQARGPGTHSLHRAARHQSQATATAESGVGVSRMLNDQNVHATAEEKFAVRRTRGAAIRNVHGYSIPADTCTLNLCLGDPPGRWKICKRRPLNTCVGR